MKKGGFSLVGGYAGYGLGFGTPLMVGLHGLLLSPGKSIFLFTPLLLLLPLTLPPLGRRYRAETVTLLAVAAAYLLLYAEYDQWHGAWRFGPRIVAAITPFLLLPLAGWLPLAGARRPHGRRRARHRGARHATAPRGGQLLLRPPPRALRRVPTPYGFLFVPELSPPAAHLRALLAADGRVDLWLVQLHRDFGTAVLLLVLVPWLLVLGHFAWRLADATRTAELTGAA